MGTFSTVCSTLGGGVVTADQAGCAQHLTVEGALQQAVDSYLLQMGNVREAYVSGNNPGIGTSVLSPSDFAASLAGTAQAFAQMYPGTSPADLNALVVKYQNYLLQAVSTYGITPNGQYSQSLDNQPQDLIFPDEIQPTPIVPTTNITAYNPSTGFHLPIDSMPVTVSPTIPAYTSPTNVAAASAPAVAASGGTMTPGTAAGVGPTVGGASNNAPQQTGAVSAAQQAGIMGSSNGKLWLILLGLAIVVFMFGRGE